ncbi:MAG: DNA-directed RNA polymerase subunit alpha [Chloroflexi bacterium]|nr:DNA-directed RNA polymerase subunit alpha [Chloroflexota bacterium]
MAIPTVEEGEGGSDTYGRFVAEPLEPGFGTTLGNALRRTLLSALPGAAVTRVKIEGVLHEFGSLPHMKEDVTEFLLNVKEIRLRALSGRPGRLFLNLSGQREVKVGDIDASADYEVVNPDLHLASLDSSEARLNVEFEVERGKGYVPANPESDHPIGMIPVDALFSPVRQVNFTVDRIRVGEATGYERLVLEVWTDGAITPSDAVRQSGEILSDQLSRFAHLGQPPGVSATQRAKRLDIPTEQYEMSIEALGLSQRTLNCLKRAGLNTVGQVLEKTPQELMSIRHFGEKSWEELEAKLREQGLLPSQPEPQPSPEAGDSETPVLLGEEDEDGA